MTAIVEQLRDLQSGAQWVCGETAATLSDAADEIERLRAALRLIIENTHRDNAATPTTLLAGCALIAKKALGND